MFYTNFNNLGIVADITYEVGSHVKTTANAGLIMWSEDGHTYIASEKAYRESARPANLCGIHLGLGGDWIPHCWDFEVRKNLGVV